MPSYSNGVFGGLKRLLVSACVAGAILALPPAALACSGGVSAVNVYKECVPSGSGGKATNGQTTTGTSTGATSTAVPISKKAALALRKAGKDEKSLSDLVKAFGGARLLQSNSGTSEPSAMGSAFDLGSGPTALLIILAGTAVLLLVATGLRGVRERRH
jgi:hypothetical protein